GRDIGRIDQHGHSNGLGHQLMQEPQPLGCDLLGEIVDAGGVAARPGKAGDKTKLDRVFSDAEDNRDRRGRSFGCLGSKVAGRRGDNGDAPAHEVSHERWQRSNWPSSQWYSTVTFWLST